MKWFVVVGGALLALAWGIMSQLEGMVVRRGAGPLGIASLKTSSRLAIVGLLALVLFLIPSQRKLVSCATPLCWGTSLGIGVLGALTAVGFVFLLRAAPASVAVSFTNPLSIVFTVLIGVMFFKEKISTPQWFGIGLAVASSVFLSLNGTE